MEPFNSTHKISLQLTSALFASICKLAETIIQKSLTRSSFSFLWNGSCVKRNPQQIFPVDLRVRCSRQSSEEESGPSQVPLAFALANCPQSTLWQNTFLGSGGNIEGVGWRVHPKSIHESWWTNNYTNWWPSGPARCITTLRSKDVWFWWLFILDL